MTVTAPPTDPAGAALDAQVAALVALIAETPVAAPVQASYAQALNAAQVACVEHYMVTGWNSAVAILALYSAPAWDKEGQKISTRVGGLTVLLANATAAGMPPGNANGYGSAGWTTIASAFAQQLYAKQIELVEHLMNLPGGTSAATILATMTGVQTNPAGIAFEYVFNSVGFTDADIDD